MGNPSAEVVPHRAAPPQSPPPPPADSPADSSAVSAPASSSIMSTDTVAWRSHQHHRQHPQRHPNSRPARPTPPALRSGNACAPAARASRRAAALCVTARRLIVAFVLLRAPGLSYPLRLCMLHLPSPMRSLQPYALQDARRLCASPPAD